MVIRQYVADYGQEADMLREVASLIARADNRHLQREKLYLPLLESRMIMNRIRVHVTDMPHLICCMLRDAYTSCVWGDAT